MSGEESEDQILRRLLCSPNNAPVQAKTRERPYVDPRFGVTFEEGTAIFRNGRTIQYRHVRILHTCRAAVQADAVPRAETYRAITAIGLFLPLPHC